MGIHNINPIFVSYDMKLLAHIASFKCWAQIWSIWWPGGWRTPVILLPGGLMQWMIWDWGFCRLEACVEQVSVLRQALTWIGWRNRTDPGYLRRSESGQKGKPSSQKFPCLAIVGSRQWAGVNWQLDQYNQTFIFLLSILRHEQSIMTTNYFQKGKTIWDRSYWFNSNVDDGYSNLFWIAVEGLYTWSEFSLR